VLDLSPKMRTAFAVAYLAGQGMLVVTAYLRPDRIFGFQMFNESSTIDVRLARRVRRADGRLVLVPLVDGSWQARDASGSPHTFRWTDRVTDPILSRTGRPVHASYGVETQLFRLQAALDDVARHTAGDEETLAFVADVDVDRNGHQRFRVHLEGARP
jgi:hypothetical protein